MTFGFSEQQPPTAFLSHASTWTIASVLASLCAELCRQTAGHSKQASSRGLGLCLFLLLVDQSVAQSNMHTSIYMLFFFFLGSIALFIISRVLLPFVDTNHTWSNLQRKFMLVQSACFPTILLSPAAMSSGICLFTANPISFLLLRGSDKPQSANPSAITPFYPSLQADSSLHI